MLVQSDGKLVIGGAFTMIGSVARNHLARLNADGTLDTAFNPNVDGPVLSLLQLADGRLLIGGEFDHVGGQARQSIARLEPTGALASGFSYTATTVRGLALQADGGILVAASAFSNSMQTRTYLARLTAAGMIDADFAPFFNGNINAIAVQADAVWCSAAISPSPAAPDGRTWRA